VLQSREIAGQAGPSGGGASFNGAFAGIHIDRGASVDMSGSENGSTNNNAERRGGMTSPGRTLGPRSASPAKRSAADMEDAGNGSGEAAQPLQQAVPADSPKAMSNGIHDMEEDTSDTKPEPNATRAQDTASTQGTITQNTSATSLRFNGTEAHDMTPNSATASTQGTITQNSSATSLESNDAPPPYTEEDAWRKGSSSSSGKACPSIDEQVQEVSDMVQKAPLDEGTRGYIVSTKWLGRVLARSTELQSSGDFPKEAREGDIGPVDNSDIVPEGAFTSTLMDGSNAAVFVPLRPGLSREADFQVLPEKAWGRVCEWYTMVSGQKPIVRYAHNTAEAPKQNIEYEIYPPVFTIRKVPQPGQGPERPASSSGSVNALRLKREQAARGQTSPDDAVMLVSSQSERFQKFLVRSKEAVGIPRSTKVKIWRFLDLDSVNAGESGTLQATVMSPPPSCSTSPKKSPARSFVKLILPPSEFKAMEVGKHAEYVDAKDETNNDKYNGTSTMDVYGLYADQTLLLEEQIGGPGGGEFASDDNKISTKQTIKKDGSRPGSTTASGRTSPAPGGMTTRGRARRDGRVRGTVGLTNLGNTCYMNSALQCIRSVEELAIYFLSGKHKQEINGSNPLGHGGSMARSYATVLQNIYGDQSTGSFNPNLFKRTLGQIQPLFGGYGQQDSQEFLSFLVDALHEDLNRIITKPYNENPDSDDSTVHDKRAIIELGETYRANHRARNDSIAMDLFSGFYKNTMECPACEKVSITFDPYSLVTVQLPIESTIQHTITFVPLDGAPVNHAIDMDKNTTVKAIKGLIASKHPGVAADRMWMIEVYNHKIYKVFEDKQTLAELSIQTNDYIFLFELPGVPTNIPEPSKSTSFYSTYSMSSQKDKGVPEMDSPKADRFAVPVFSRQQNRYGSGWDMIMHPLYIMVTREEAQDYDVILKKVLVAVSRQTSRPILTELDQDQGQAADAAGPDISVEKDESASEDAGRVSDRSVPSEDGYVDVSVAKAEQDEGVETGPAASASVSRTIPPSFMDPQYFLSPALRNHLFTLGYAESAEGLLCTGTTSIGKAYIMFDRVRQPLRRPSVHSSISDETTSSGSHALTGETEESDADDDEDSARRQPTPAAQTVVDSETDSLPENPIKGLYSRGGSGKPNKFKSAKNKRNKKIKTYGRSARYNKGRPDSRGSLQSTNSPRSLGKVDQDANNPYYIKLGEGIVIDWYPEALDSLFGGDAGDENDLRGHWLSSPDGRSVPFMPDPELEEKKSRRAARKKHGITLEDCFVETGKREILSEDNAWYCSRCKEMRQAAKTLEIWTIPDILIVHLKRFGGNRSFRDKIDVLVDYPIVGLDMREKVGFKDGDKEYLYDLFAVDNHYGGLGGGHYTALAKNFNDGQWYDYNGESTDTSSARESRRC